MSSTRRLFPSSALLVVAVLVGPIRLPVVSRAQEKPECTVADCDQAKDFFAKFQKAVDGNHRQEVVTLVRYPLRSYHKGKVTVFKTKAQLLAGYDTVFTVGVRCAIQSASLSDVWGNWRGFTIGAGAIWWERIIPNSATNMPTSDLSNYPFGVFSVNHSPETDKTCSLHPDVPLEP
jgi:hypothetical protein